jgi:hypothetical protein
MLFVDRARADTATSTRKHSTLKVQPSFRSYTLGNTGALLIALLAAYVALRVSGTATSEELSPRTVDFLMYYSAGHLATSVHPEAMYQWIPMLRVEQQIAYPFLVPVAVMQPFFVYPPLAGLAFAPFALLPYDLARVAWLAVECLALVMSLYYLERMMGLTGRLSFLFRLSVFAFLPVFQMLYQGQITDLLLLATIGGFLALQSGRYVVAGACLAVLAVEPQYLLPILLVLLVRGERRVMAWGALWLGCGAALGLALYGLAATVGYVRALVTLPQWGQHSGRMLSGTNEGLYGLAHAITSGSMANVLWFVAALAVLAGLAAWAWRAPAIDGPLAGAVVAGLLVSPHVLLYNLTLLLLPLAVYVQWSTRRGFTTAPWVVLLYVAITATIPLGLIMQVRLSPLAMLLLAALTFRATLTNTSVNVRSRADERSKPATA